MKHQTDGGEATLAKGVPTNLVTPLFKDLEATIRLKALFTAFEGEPIVKASVDKFYGTELEAFLRRKGVKSVLIVGTAAEGAVLHTATAAAMRGFDVVVPVDGMSSSEIYAEQYTAWHLVNAPGSRRRARLTRTDMIRFKD